MNTIKVNFLGTGTSQGVPVIGCQCEVCRSKDTHDKRLRSSVLVQIGDKNILIDAGPDFRQQMLRAGIKKIDAILITHAHHDHIGGLDEIRSFNYLQQKPMDIYGQDMVFKSLYKTFHYVFAENPYPGVPEMSLHTIDKDHNFIIDEIGVTPIESIHLELPIMGYRIGDFAYITDANFIAPEELEKLKGLKTLVLNALRKEKHISHFSLSEALDIANIVKPEKLYLTHISHDMGLYKEVQKELPHNIFLAYDGLEVTI